jgi:hypothetical protein
MTAVAGFELDARLAGLMGWVALESTYSMNDSEPMEWKGIPADFPREPSPPPIHDMVRRGTFLDGAKFYRERIWHGGMVYVPHFSTRIEHAFADYGPVAHLRRLGWEFTLSDWKNHSTGKQMTTATFLAPAIFLAPSGSDVLDDEGGEVDGDAPRGEDPLAITLAAVAALERIAAQPAEVGA